MAVIVTTPDYWDVDGTPLNTYAYNIASLAGRTATPGVRGEDQEQAYRPGRSFRPKVAESRSVPLSMWVQGSDPELAGSSSQNSSEEFMSNLRMLQKLFFKPRGQITLTKRWTDLEGSHTAAALGQVINPIQPSHTKNRATLVVDVFLADPFFYDTTVTNVPVTTSTPGTTNNPGDDTSPTHLKVTFTGPLTSPVLRNTTPNPDIALSYNGTIAAGQTLVVDVPASRAVLGGALVNNLLSYTGSIWPMEVFPGVNNFTLTASSGTGSATVSYRAAYV